MRRLAAALCVFALSSAPSCFGGPAAVVTLDGQRIPLRLSAEGKIAGMEPGEIFAIQFRPKADPVTDGFIVTTDYASQFFARSLQTQVDAVELTTALLGAIKLPLSAVRTIQRADFAAQTDLARAAAARPNRDVMLIESDSGALTLTGLFKGVRFGRFVFHWQEADCEVEAMRMRALALAAPTAPVAMPGGFVALAGDRDTVTGRLKKISDEVVILETPLLGEVVIPREKIAMLDLVAGRRVWVSDLTPAEAHTAGFFGEPQGWQRDRSVSGQPLRLRREGKVESFTKGIGTRARCVLTYSLAGKYRALIGVLGIDAAAAALGAAEFVVTADGKEIFRSGVVKAGEEPRRMFLRVAGAQTLTLRSDFAPNTFGVAAHANWADLQLVE